MVGVAVVGVAVVEIAMIEVAVVEVAVIDNRSAVGDVGIVVVNRRAAMPVISPVMPAPPKSSEVTDSKSNTERESDAAPKNPGHSIPAWVGNNRRTVHQPRIISWHIDHLWISRFDDDCASLRRYPLLFVAVQMAGLPSLLTHLLDSIGHILLIVGIRIAKR